MVYFGPGEFYRPGNATLPQWDGQILFLLAVADCVPDVLRTLETDVFPVYRSDPSLYYSDGPEDELEEALLEWQKQWNLTDDWIQKAAFFSFHRWHGLCDSGTFVFRDVWPALSHFQWGHLDVQPFRLEFHRWDPERTGRTRYVEQLREAFEAATRDYCERVETQAEAAGLKRLSRKRARTGDADLHFEWLARWQVLEWSYPQVAKHYGVAESTVRKEIPKTAALIGLTRRTLFDK